MSEQGEERKEESQERSEDYWLDLIGPLPNAGDPKTAGQPAESLPTLMPVPSRSRPQTLQPPLKDFTRLASRDEPQTDPLSLGLFVVSGIVLLGAAIFSPMLWVPLVPAIVIAILLQFVLPPTHRPAAVPAALLLGHALWLGLGMLAVPGAHHAIDIGVMVLLAVWIAGRPHPIPVVLLWGYQLYCGMQEWYGLQTPATQIPRALAGIFYQALWSHMALRLGTSLCAIAGVREEMRAAEQESPYQASAPTVPLIVPSEGHPERTERFDLTWALRGAATALAGWMLGMVAVIALDIIAIQFPLPARPPEVLGIAVAVGSILCLLLQVVAAILWLRASENLGIRLASLVVLILPLGFLLLGLLAASSPSLIWARFGMVATLFGTLIASTLAVRQLARVLEQNLMAILAAVLSVGWMLQGIHAIYWTLNETESLRPLLLLSGAAFWTLNIAAALVVNWQVRSALAAAMEPIAAVVVDQRPN